MALAAGVAVVVLLGASQAFLPGLAAQRVREKMKPYGGLQQVSISAFPAVKLLWGNADRVQASARALTLNGQEATKLTWEGRGVHDMDLSVDALTLNVAGLPAGVVLRDVTSHKRGARLSLEGTLSQSDIDAALPAGFSLQLLASPPDSVKVRASGSLFGVGASVEALAAPIEGKLVAQPLNIPFGQFVRLTLFSDPHVHLEGISLTPLQASSGESWRLAMSERLV